MHSATEITLRGMRFHALIGILPHEREIPQPLEIDLTVWLSTELTRESASNPAAIVDYRWLYDRVSATVAAGPTGYIEALAVTIADRALEDPRLSRARVTVRKPNVALPGPLAGAEVRVERARHA
jgi:dihydroneopterin aldolase